ncbi:phosphatase [bacterium]|nr:phosphatase [bacterium]
MKFEKTSLEDIVNFHKISHRLITSGQPEESQFQLIKDYGCEVVINLASKSTLQNEQKTAEALGMKYIHIPVDFKNPLESDFSQFSEAMTSNNTIPILVHCIANMRASAFVYRYRHEILGIDKLVAEKDLLSVWKPTGIWQKFLQWQ